MKREFIVTVASKDDGRERKFPFRGLDADEVWDRIASIGLGNWKVVRVKEV